MLHVDMLHVDMLHVDMLHRRSSAARAFLIGTYSVLSTTVLAHTAARQLSRTCRHAQPLATRRNVACRMFACRAVRVMFYVARCHLACYECCTRAPQAQPSTICGSAARRASPTHSTGSAAVYFMCAARFQPPVAHRRRLSTLRTAWVPTQRTAGGAVAGYSRCGPASRYYE
jgi:hypothetical protein